MEQRVELYQYLWAKTDPYKELLCHMLDVGCCAKVYLSAPASTALLSYLSDQWNCSSAEALGFAAYLFAMHDIGKATPQFQMQSDDQLARLKGTEINEILPATGPESIRHEFLSRRIANRIWKKQGDNKRLYDAYSCVLALHHQKIDTSVKHKPKVYEEWQLIQDELEAAVREAFQVSFSLLQPKELDPVCALLTGLLILCDWVASSDPFDVLPEMTDHYLEKSEEIAGKAMKQYGLIEDHRMQQMKSFQEMWPQITDLRDIQSKCELLDPEALLTMIEAPMGEGKTEAALFYAGRAAALAGKRGIYIALPTQATSNQMYGRFINMLEDIHGGYVRLLHGTAFLQKNDQRIIQSADAYEAEKWLGTSRMGLLDENGVGTVDQAMGAVLLSRFSILRLLGLANKALIIDELHAYDAYMSEIIESLLRWCCALEIPVILLSATLQKSQRKKYLSCYSEGSFLPELSEAYPLITQVGKDHKISQTTAAASMKTDYSFKAIRIGQDEKETARFAMEQIRGGGCYCILANTVNRAQKIYRELECMRDPDTEILLFHARFPMKRREEIERTCLQKFGKGAGAQRPAKAVLVATQVVEQSLDIDFDGMISELAPIDLLLQRAGRVHRHRNRIRPAGLEKPVIYVVLPDQQAEQQLDQRYGSSGFVYDPFLLYNTETLLRDDRTIQVPGDVRSVIAQVYEKTSEENMKAWIKRCFNEQLLTANADWVAFPPPKADYFFPTQSHPELQELNIDDGFDAASHVATRLGEPTFRIAFISGELLESARKNRLSDKQQKEILLSSAALRLTPEIRNSLSSGDLYQITKGSLYGCYLADQDSIINIGNKNLINDPVIGIYWEG